MPTPCRSGSCLAQHSAEPNLPRGDGHCVEPGFLPELEAEVTAHSPRPQVSVKLVKT